MSERVSLRIEHQCAHSIPRCASYQTRVCIRLTCNQNFDIQGWSRHVEFLVPDISRAYKCRFSDGPNWKPSYKIFLAPKRIRVQRYFSEEEKVNLSGVADLTVGYNRPRDVPLKLDRSVGTSRSYFGRPDPEVEVADEKGVW
jgi:hypothetical protein